MAMKKKVLSVVAILCLYVLFLGAFTYADGKGILDQILILLGLRPKQETVKVQQPIGGKGTVSGGGIGTYGIDPWPDPPVPPPPPPSSATSDTTR